MSQTVGTVNHDELWLRCPECGDSQSNPNKGHLSINLRKGVFHCVRCSYGGSLTIKQVFDLMAIYDLGSVRSAIPHELIPVNQGAGSTRFSALPRYSYVDELNQTWDVFSVRDPVHDEQVGQYLRFQEQSLLFGETGLGYVGNHLKSSPDRPLRLVEGPYDVLSSQDVCCFGFIRRSQINLLKGHVLLLCPDGDVWEDQQLRERMTKILTWSLNANSLHVVGLEMIPDGLDPDECHPTDRLYVDRNTLLRRLSQRRVTIDLGRYMQ